MKMICTLYIKDILVKLYCKALPHSFTVNVCQNGIISIILLNGIFYIILHPEDKIFLALCDLCLKMDGPKATINKYL